MGGGDTETTSNSHSLPTVGSSVTSLRLLMSLGGETEPETRDEGHLKTLHTPPLRSTVSPANGLRRV